MKKLFIIITLFSIYSCDKVKRPIESTVVPNSLDESLYPGDFTSYPWPTFEENVNTNRNFLIEDYTGHTCVYCPLAAETAEELETENSGRVFVASIHASPGGIGDFQKLEPPTFVHDFTTTEGILYGTTFENGFGFTGNPRGTINRITFDGFIFQASSNWESQLTTVLSENNLKVNLQSHLNYYESTRGVFLHTEIDPMTLSNDSISIVVYLIENTFIAPQKKSGEGTILDYNHHNVHRGNIDGLAFGRTLNDDYKKENGLYQVDISYKLPDAYDPTNTHLLVYAMNPITYEIYQVIKVNIQ
jgi:hypothetical protein